jgi:hypothetical protein
MRTRDAIAAFGSVKALADALGITTQAVYAWGPALPELRQYQVEHILAARTANG